jgi:hypothetical protein
LKRVIKLDAYQFVQMCNLLDVKENDLPQLAGMIAELHADFGRLATSMEFTGVTLHKYYQAARTTVKLNFLVSTVWHRLQIDRKGIEKSVSEKANSLYYEGEMLEKDLRIAIRR